MTDSLYGNDWCRADLEALADGWSLEDVTETDDETELVFKHETTAATCTVTADHETVDLPHSMRFDPPTGDAIPDESDWADEIILSAQLAMRAYHSGTQH